MRRWDGGTSPGEQTLRYPGAVCLIRHGNHPVYSHASENPRWNRTLPSVVRGWHVRGRQYGGGGRRRKRRDFIHKVAISCKEAREARYWLRLCSATSMGDPEQCRALLKESDELVR